LFLTKNGPARLGSRNEERHETVEGRFEKKNKEKMMFGRKVVEFKLELNCEKLECI